MVCFPGNNESVESLGIFILDDSHPRASIVHVFGEATFAETKSLESAIVGAVRIGRPVVIDMRECRYMDCGAVGVIVRAAKNLGDQLRLAMPRHGQGYRILEISGLTRVLHIFETVDEAAGALGEPAPLRPRLRAV
ncbi:MAG TPA: STAS domain-containing protein [Candidatus Lustribacter sp.]|nr:STAS domain-containing protein [Candidatus Lustribacter sp.]